MKGDQKVIRTEVFFSFKIYNFKIQIKMYAHLDNL